MQIAILGWGSLIWDRNHKFVDLHKDWQLGGPLLKLEFSRVSVKARPGVLTLVIDAQNGTACQVAYCWSKRTAVDDAINDLKCREDTALKHIGFIDNRNNQIRFRDEESKENISKWVKSINTDAVIWTDLPSNFEAEIKVPFLLMPLWLISRNSAIPNKCRHSNIYVRRLSSFKLRYVTH